MLNREWYEQCVADAQQGLALAKKSLALTLDARKWHMQMLELLQGEEARAMLYVTEAEARLAEYQGWLDLYDMRGLGDPSPAMPLSGEES